MENSKNHDNILNHTLFGFTLSIIMFFGFFLWAITFELHGAVIANGAIVVETNLKKIQHPTGGIISKINIIETQKVHKDDVLFYLDDTITRANFFNISKQLDQFYARRARLEAERDGEELINFPSALILAAQNDSDASRIIIDEQNLFTARASQRTVQKKQLLERIDQMKNEIEGLEYQRTSKETEIGIIRTELIVIEYLFKKNLVAINRLMSLQREEARIDGERGALLAQIATLRGKISEVELQIINIKSDLSAEVARDLTEIQLKISEYNERRVIAKDQISHLEVRSPIAGIIHQLSVHTVGGVIQPGETLVQIVPFADKLVIELKVAPNDIEPVKIGTPAKVRFLSLNQRTTPEINGEVIQVGADIIRDQQTGITYFLVRIGVSEIEIEKLGSNRLLPGMPAEVFIETKPRTAMSYLVKPITDQFTRALRER